MKATQLSKFVEWKSFAVFEKVSWTFISTKYLSILKDDDRRWFFNMKNNIGAIHNNYNLGAVR